jgi:hypothetical protein
MHAYPIHSITVVLSARCELGNLERVLEHSEPAPPCRNCKSPNELLLQSLPSVMSF